MKFKTVPEPPADLSAVEAAQQAVPRVPGSTDDCCARLVDRTAVPDRDTADTWLAFLRALELADETESGFYRADRDVDPDRLADRFRERVYGADDVLDIVAGTDDPLSADAVFEQFRETVPEWERRRNPDAWEPTWRQRVEHLLGWAVLFGLLDRTDAGYVATD